MGSTAERLFKTQFNATLQQSSTLVADATSAKSQKHNRVVCKNKKKQSREWDNRSVLNNYAPVAVFTACFVFCIPQAHACGMMTWHPPLT